ncbi:MAG: hypothetical protein [Wendovervirus sonii]|uniref:Uncharacterized protein n=1 Tax=phage Lak_Megaphage_Sonny TaxID=3109229 RepID=A0ABZ0Z5T5_9CAUD|nr:MAG: hypothetical protein [phage Lak_Megaphage_Sonny]
MENVIRECVNTPEHPNTVPVIPGLDVTGSMGGACKETSEALAKIFETLFEDDDINEMPECRKPEKWEISW